MSALPSLALRAELAQRLRTSSPDTWREFSTLWMAFNAIYGGEMDRRERARVMACVRSVFTDSAAIRVLRAVTKSVDQILAVPPADLRLNRWDPRFRAASARCAALYRNPAETPRSRLAGVCGTLYQVRCNLIHGSKDPTSGRDRMLVDQSLAILRVLVPALEAEALR